MILLVLSISVITEIAFGQDNPARQDLVTIAEKTTFIIKPLDDLGFPDYYAYQNRRVLEIPQGENAGLDIVRLMRTDLVDDAFRKEFCRMLGVDEYPSSNAPFVSYEEFIKVKPKRGPRQPATPSNAKLMEQYKLAYQSYWDDQECQTVARWLDTPASVSTLNALKAIDGKTKYAIPYLLPGAPQKPWSMLDVMLPYAQELRNVIRLVACHSNRLVAQKKFEEASEWILRGYHLSRLAGQQEVTIERLVSFACESNIGQVEFTFATHPDCPIEVLIKHQGKRSRLLPIEPLSPAFNMERLVLCQTFCLMARTQLPNEIETLEFLRKKLGFADQSIEDFEDFLVDFDYDILLEIHHELYDELVSFIDKPYETRRPLLEPFSKNLTQTWKQIEHSMSDLNSFPVDQRSEKFSRWYSYRLISPFEDLIMASDRIHCRSTILDAVLGIELYRRDNNEIPASLEQLVPKYLHQIPADLFNGNHLKYVIYQNDYQIYSVGPDPEGQDKPFKGVFFYTRETRKN